MNILVFQHVPHESPGYIADYAKEKGITLTVLELWKPYTMPDVRKSDALIVLGGPMGVYEDYPSKKDELKVIKESIGKIPVLGICLGSQLLAHALGANVYKNMTESLPAPRLRRAGLILNPISLTKEKVSKRAKEIGYYDIDLTKAGRESPLFKCFFSPFRVLQWHGDAFDLPKGATLLASTPLCQHQAFSWQYERTNYDTRPTERFQSFGRAKLRTKQAVAVYGTLFHTEFTVDMVKNLADIDRKWTHEDFNLDEQKLLTEAESLAPLMKKQCYRLLDNLLAS